MCKDTPVITGDYSLTVAYNITDLEPCQSYRIVITAVTGAGKKSKEAAYITSTGFAGKVGFTHALICAQVIAWSCML